MGNANRPIGIFDSGVGGLTVMRAFVDQLPREDFVYLGDTARVPYGNRGEATVRQYARNATRLLVDRDVKMLVVACNTASAYALDALRDGVDVPVVGVVDPVAEQAATRTKSGVVGVLGTRGTVRSACYPNALEKFDDALEVHQKACPLLVPLAEEGWTEGPVAERIATEYLGALKPHEIDTLILGCTHYPVLREVLESVVGELFELPVSLLDSGSATARRAERELQAADLGRERRERGDLQFMLTDLSPAFVDATERFFGDRPEEIRHVDIVPETGDSSSHD